MNQAPRRKRKVGDLVTVIPALTHAKFTDEQLKKIAPLSRGTIDELEALCMRVRSRPYVAGEADSQRATTAQRLAAVERLCSAIDRLQDCINELPGEEISRVVPLNGGQQLGAQLSDNLDQLRESAGLRHDELQLMKNRAGGRYKEMTKPLVVECIRDCLLSEGLTVSCGGQFQRIAEVCFELAKLHGGAESAIKTFLKRQAQSTENSVGT